MAVTSSAVSSTSRGRTVPLRVCILARKRLASNTRIFNQAKTLAEAGYDVTIISLAEVGLPAFEQTKYYRLYRIQLAGRGRKRRVRVSAVFIRRFKRIQAVFIRRFKRIQAVFIRRLRRIYALSIRRAFRVSQRAFKRTYVTAIRRLTPLIPEEKRQLLKRVQYRLAVATNTVITTTWSATLSIIRVAPLIGRFLIQPLGLIIRLMQLGGVRVKPVFQTARPQYIALVRRVRAGVKVIKTWWGWQERCFSYRLRSFMASLQFFFASMRIIRQNPADVYHAHDSYPLLATYVASRLHGAKLVYDAVEFSPDRNRPTGTQTSWLWAKVEAYIVRRVDVVLAVGESSASLIAQAYKIRKPIVVMNCREYQQVCPTHTLPRQLRLDSKKIILYIGAITANNGLEQLILAAPYIQNAVIVIMGPVTFKNFDSELRTLIERTGVEDRVFIIEPIKPKQVIPYASSADLGIIPIQKNCLNHSCALPNKLFDYIMARLPVVTSDIPDIRRVVELHQIGAVFDEQDPKSIALTINQLLSNGTAYQKMKENLEKCAKVYCWENEEKKFLQLYSCLNIRAKGGSR